MVLGIDVGPVINKEFHNLRSCPLGGGHEDRLAVFILHIDIEAFLDEKFHEFELPRQGSVHEDGFASIVLGHER